VTIRPRPFSGAALLKIIAKRRSCPFEKFESAHAKICRDAEA
jgi:hypothetical protein